MSGYFPIDHGDLEHPVFGVARRPYTRWEAYCWLLDHAAFDRTETAFQGKPVTLDRGQVASSLNEMARTWKWTRAAVQRFIKGLISASFVTYSPANVASTGPDTSADTPPDTGVSVLTLCKYSGIAERKKAADTSADTPTDIGADTPATSTQYRDIYVKNQEGKKAKRVTPTPSALPPTPPQGDLLPTAEVVVMRDDAQTAYDAYRAVAKDLGLAVPMHRLDGKRRSLLRQCLKDLGGLEGWSLALDALRGASFITSGRWKAFSVDDMVTRKKLEKLLAGGYTDVWGEQPENQLWAATLRHRQDHPEDSLFHEFDQNGALKHR